jgi:hypothetical protein
VTHPVAASSHPHLLLESPRQLELEEAGGQGWVHCAGGRVAGSSGRTMGGASPLSRLPSGRKQGGSGPGACQPSLARCTEKGVGRVVLINKRALHV